VFCCPHHVSSIGYFLIFDRRHVEFGVVVRSQTTAEGVATDDVDGLGRAA